jgi:ATP-dependent Zn protease
MIDETESKKGGDGPVEAGLRATAYHEAGHAVMAISLGRPIQKVSIAPGQSHLGAKRLGVCQIKKGRTRATKDWLEDEVLILYAGMVAESQVTGDYSFDRAGDDLRCIRRYVQMRAVGQRQVERLERRLLDKTENHLSDETLWNAVDAIAAELLRCETISGRAAQHLYDQAHSRGA